MTRLEILSVPSSIDEITGLALDAENAGFDSVRTGEYFWRKAFTTLTTMAMATRRVVVGSGIVYTFLRSPVQTDSWIAASVPGHGLLVAARV